MDKHGMNSVDFVFMLVLLAIAIFAIGGLAVVLAFFS
jgi:hypothetical protein